MPRQFTRRVVVTAALAAGTRAMPARSVDLTTQPQGSNVKDIRFVVFHTTGPNWQEGKSMFEQPGVMEHVGHYKKLLEAGKLALGGPHLDAKGGGMMIATTGVPEEELRAFAAEDPAVKSGVLKFEVRPWLIGMSA